MDNDFFSIHSTVSGAFAFENADKDPTQLSPLVLAYIGDTVYDMYVRTYIIHTTDKTAHGMHMQATSMVRAQAQAEAFHKIEDMLDDDEMKIYKRGRNSKMNTIPKHAKLIDYKVATGFEALIGYLYLSGNDKRINEIINKAIGGKENA